MKMLEWGCGSDEEGWCLEEDAVADFFDRLDFDFLLRGGVGMASAIHAWSIKLYPSLMMSDKRKSARSLPGFFSVAAM
jgi:hypothetical protein